MALAVLVVSDALVQLVERRATVRGAAAIPASRRPQADSSISARRIIGRTPASRAQRNPIELERVGGLHARQHRDAHQHGVVLLLSQRERAGAAEPLRSGSPCSRLSSLTSMAPSPRPIPRPGRAGRARRSSWRGDAPTAGSAPRAGRRVPGEDALAPRRIVARVGRGRAGRGRELPFVPGRQPRALRFAVGLAANQLTCVTGCRAIAGARARRRLPVRR